MLEQTYLKNIPDHIQKPVQELITLNFRTLQNFSIFKTGRIKQLASTPRFFAKKCRSFLKTVIKH